MAYNSVAFFPGSSPAVCHDKKAGDELVNGSIDSA